MMGPYSYYCDATFVDDCSTEIHVHDCMWSGECYICQQARTTLAQVPENSEVEQLAMKHEFIEMIELPGAIEDEALEEAEEQPQVQEEAESCQQPTVIIRPQVQQPQQQQQQQQQQRAVTLSKPIKREPDEQLQLSYSDRTPTTATTATAPKPSNDNKKLRHREVEKNRHRQLQAMVKTLSEKIPGRLDKETQVQTMKRAARYCLYLRDVLTTLAHGQPLSGNVLKDRLEKIYLRSSNHVEFIMQQSLSMN